MGFIQDVAGSITAGRFYRDLLTRPIKQGWYYFFKLITIISLITAVFWSIRIFNYYNDAIEFFAKEIKKVEFTSGEITNMPLSHHRLLFRDKVIHVDKSYIDKQSLQENLENDPQADLFVGPGKAFFVRNSEIMEFNYPSSYKASFDTDKLRNMRTYLFPAVALATWAGFFIYRLITALLYIILVITPIVLFKFRRMGLSFKGGFQVGLYLASLQVVIATILMLLSIHIPWGFLWFILFYVIYIGALVNVDVSKGSKTA